MLEEIKNNFERLIALYEAEKSRGDVLSAKLSEAQESCESYRKQISDLERKIDNLRLTEAFTAPSDASRGAKEKIDKLIREIDKCISQLEK